MCETISHPYANYVYISHSIRHQRIITLLNDNAPEIYSNDDECVNLMFRVLCHYYLPPCDISHNNTIRLTSLCQEECAFVQSRCESTWKAAESALGRDLFIDCNDTSRLLYPQPHCCSEAGIEITHATSDPTVAMKSDTSKTTLSMWIGISASILVAIVILVVVILLLSVYRKIHKRKQMEKMQIDILPR